MQNEPTTLHSDSSRSPYNQIQLGALVKIKSGVLQHVDRSGTFGEAMCKMEQYLIDHWKEYLVWQPTLQMCVRQNLDTGFHYILKPRAWYLLQSIYPLVFDLYNKNKSPNPNLTPKSLLLEFLSLTPSSRYGKERYHASAHLQAFTTSSVPQALVMLYTSSPHQPNRDLANGAIREFIHQSSNYEDHWPNYKHSMALSFSKWLRWAAGIYDPLYAFCCSNLNDYDKKKKEKDGLRELANRLLHDLELSKEKSLFSSYVGPALRDIKDLAAFLVLVKTEIMALLGAPAIHQMREDQLCRLPLSKADEITCLHQVFLELLHKLDECLVRIEEEQVDGGMKPDGRRHYLAILKELYTISKLYQGAEEVFRETMKQRKVALSSLIVRFANRINDHKWILEAKELTNFETRRHLAMMMLPDVGSEDEEEMHVTLINRSSLFAESFEFIARANPISLGAGLFIKFKNEDTALSDVRREWLYLLCQAIFSPQNTLFLACPNDDRRFFPNPASKVDPLHLEYFRFSGRVIALAMIHKVQVGIVFDRVFFLQLAGHSISIEDIRDADPDLYSSCKKILEMDPETVDQDALGLTVVYEAEESGERRKVELCTDGGSVVVNSKNRKQYVDSLIQHRFVTAVSEQIAHFAQGFADIMIDGSLQRSFFQCLEIEDLDRMLYGSGFPYI